MTEDQDTNQTSSEPKKSNSGKLRGCGCLAFLCLLGLGILIIGKFDATSWASALSAIVIGFLVFSLSGVNGMWEDK